MLKTLIPRLTSGWTFTRIIRLALNIVILIQAYHMQSILFALLGTWFLGQAALGIGCCGTQGCGVPLYKEVEEAKEVTYEKIEREDKNEKI